MGSATYWLAKGCFACRAQGFWIILSVDQDKYLCVQERDIAALGRRLQGLAMNVEETECASDRALEAGPLIDSLLLSGIITDDASKGKPFAELECSVPDSSLEVRDLPGPVRLSIPLIFRFVIASVGVDCRLRRRGIARALNRVARIGRRLRRRARRENCFDRDKVWALIAAFARLRPFYPRPFLCLFDSLALLEFLASYHVSAQVVLGVIADPFEAHCWLQCGSMVLNDDLELVGRYKPILMM